MLVPGLAFAIVFLVATPVQVIEGRSAFESFRRSATLTKGARSEVFGLIVTAFYLSLGIVVAPVALFDPLWRAAALHRLRIAKGEIVIKRPEGAASVAHI